VVSQRTECRERVTERGTREGVKEGADLGTVAGGRGMPDAGITEKKKKK